MSNYQIKITGRLQVRDILDNKNISGLSIWNGRAIVVTDEPADKQGNVAQIFEMADKELRPVPGGVIRLDKLPAKKSTGKKKKAKEMDLEGVAVDGNTVYVLGSHSARRPKVDPAEAYKDNRENLLGTAEAQPARDVLLKFKLDADGNPSKKWFALA